MICTIHGILCKTSEKVNSKTNEVIPVAYVFSGDETVTVNNISCNPKAIGSTVSLDVEIKNREFEGRKYTTIIALEQKGG